MQPTNAEHIVIHAQAGDYATFPSIQRDAAGALYITFRSAPDDLEEGRYSHIDVRSVARVKKSTDRGQSWQEIGAPLQGHLPQAGVQDPSLTILADGTFLLTYFHWRSEPDHPRARQGAVMEGVWVRRSTDQGASWGQPAHVPPAHVPAGENTQLAISEPAIELAGGELLLAGYASIPQGGGQAALLSRSAARGVSWSTPSIIAHDPDGMVDFQEPALLDLGDGHLLCVMRAVDRHLTADQPDEDARRRGQTAWMYQTHS